MRRHRIDKKYAEQNVKFIFGEMMSVELSETDDYFDITTYDHYVYIGTISREGYRKLTQEIEKKDDLKEAVMLTLITSGGDPNAGYRMGRALQHYYPKAVNIFIPNYCKSAGTLTSIAANKLFIGNHGELGPLDIQLLKMDELGARSSGLDIFKTLEQLENRIGPAFVRALSDIRESTGISTKMAADMAANLVQSIFSPIASQIDPMKMGEHQRATAVAMEYGKRLNKLSDNLQNEANINNLISQYPSHSFVIDRKEAQNIFKNVSKPPLSLLKNYDMIIQMTLNNDSAIQFYPPLVWEENINQQDNENDNRTTESPAESSSSTGNHRHGDESPKRAEQKRNRSNETTEESA